MKKFFSQLVQDENGNYSSKRVAGLVSVICLNVALIGNTFYPREIHPSVHLIDAVALFAFGSLGLTSIDKFTKTRGAKNV